MSFKINVSQNGKTYKLETESEIPVGKKIGESLNGSDIGPDLDGYELKITGTTDDAGFAGFKGLDGSGYHRQLLTYGPGMKDRRKGIRLRKMYRGEEISLKTSQINTIIEKEGKTSFANLTKKEGGEKKEETAEQPKEITEKAVDKKPAEVKEEVKKQPKEEVTDTDKKPAEQ